MSTRKRFHRIVSLVLSIVMLLTLAPVSALADGGITVKGEENVIEFGNNEISGRDNTFNKGWKFYLGTSSTAQNAGFDDSSWEDVDLPHDFSIIQEFTTSGEAESGFLPGGTGWYRKTFTMPAEAAGKTVLLNFDGVYSEAYVYVNGTFVGEHHYGYTSFAIDITDALVCDDATENVIAVKAVNNVPTSRWYSGSGIYRDVSLIVADSVHVDLNGTYITTPNIASGDGTVNVEVDVVNDGTAAVEVTVVNTVYAKGGETALACAESTITVDAGTCATASSAPVVETPALWSVENANLYTMVTELKVNGEVVDTVQSEFGFRWVTFNSEGCQLNGENIKLNGVCLHHDQGALGSAAYYDAMYRQLSIMKDMGCNAIRTSHNPVDEDFIAICNELGLLVIEELFDGLVDAKNGNSNDFSVYFEKAVDTSLYGAAEGMTCSEYAARSIVKRDRNAPSVFAWSFGNEIQEGTGWGNVSRYDDICANFIEWVNDEDGTRPVTSGDNNRGGNSNLVSVLNTIIAANGIVGFNYANSISSLSSLASTYGGSFGCIIASETSSAVNSRGIYTTQGSRVNADGKMHLTSYDTSAVGWGITAHESIYNTYSLDNVAGEFVWTGFDYIGEPTPWNGTGVGSVSGSGAVPNSSYFGIVETTGFEKDSYYLYRSQWNKDETTLHLVTAWDSDNMMTTGGLTPVWIYSNAPVVKLYRDGELIGTATRTVNTTDAGHVYYTYTTESSNADVCTAVATSGADRLYSIFNVAYQAGTLSAKAYEADGVTEIALSGNSGKNTVSTPGDVTKLVISQDKTEIAADGSSLVYISVDVVDANGNLDTKATNNIVFTLEGEGEIVGVDNGDQATVDKFQQASVLTGTTSANIDAYAGKALVIVRSTEDAGQITVNIASEGLTGGTVTVNTTAEEEEVSDGLVTYTMVKDYTVKAGTVPTLDTASTGNLADGSTVSGTIVWDEISSDVSGTAGDHTIRGILTFEGYDPINVAARLHVIADVVAMRNVSTATTAGVAPTLPSAVSGVLADGTLAGEFVVTWDEVPVGELNEVGDVTVVNGKAAIIGDETLPVTCTIRVAQAVRGESVNVAPMALTLEQDIPQGSWSDNLASVNNDILKPGDNTNERWTNWNYRKTSADATLTMTWATAQMVSGVNLFYYYDNCCAYPEAVEFSYSLNGEEYVVIGHTAEQVESYNLGAQYSYTFDEPINPVGLKIKLTQKSGTTGANCVGLTEIQVMSYAAAIEPNTSADLSGITVDGTPVADFNANILIYGAEGSVVTAASDANAGITILPEYEGVVRILTISEDGSTTKTYSLASLEEALKAVKAAAAPELEAYRTAKNDIAYEKAQIAELDAALAAGLAAIEAANSKEAVSAAVTEAKSDIDAVESITVLGDLSANDLDTDLPETAKFVEGETEGSRAIQGYYAINDTEKVMNAAMTGGNSFTVSARVYVPAEALSNTTGSFEGNDKFNMIASLGDNSFALRIYTSKNTGKSLIQTFVGDGSKWYQLNSNYMTASFVNNWHEISAVYSGAALTLIMDGVVLGEKTDVTSSIADSGVSFCVGYEPLKEGRTTALTIDQIVVYNEALTLEQLAEEHLPQDDNVILWMDYEDVPSVAEQAMKLVERALAAAKAAEEAALAAQTKAEEAAGSAAEDKSAAESAANTAAEAQATAEKAQAAAVEAQVAAEAAAKAAGENNTAALAEALKAAEQAVAAAEAAETAAKAMNEATGAAAKAQEAQAAAEAAQTKAEAAKLAADNAAASAAGDKTAAEAARKAAEAAESAAEAAQAKAEEALDAAKASADAAEESNLAAAEQANAAAAAAAVSAKSADNAAASAQAAAEAAEAAQEAQAKAEEAAAGAAADKEAAEQAKAEAEQAAAASALGLSKYVALLELDEAAQKMMADASADQVKKLAVAAATAGEAIQAAESQEAVAQLLADAKAEMEELAGLLCAGEEFTDVNVDEWYHDAIDFVINKGLMSGNGDGTFAPETELSRAMLVQILYNIEGKPEVQTDKEFSDVAEDDWYYDAVMWAAENEIVLGSGDGTYAPEDNVTREQMVTILYRYAGTPEIAKDAQLTFADAANVSDWAQSAVIWAVEEGVVKGKGDNRFDPAGNSTRAETAQVMLNYFGTAE